MDQCVRDSTNIPATPSIARFGWRAALFASTALLAAAATPASAQTTNWVSAGGGNVFATGTNVTSIPDGGASAGGVNNTAGTNVTLNPGGAASAGGPNNPAVGTGVIGPGVPVTPVPPVAPVIAAAYTTNWVGALSPNWFLGGNWSAGVPGLGMNAAIGHVGSGSSVRIDGGVATVGGKFDVGFADMGNLVVAGGSSLTTGASSIGTLAGITGSVIVSDSGTQWTSYSRLAVGDFGTGDLSVRTGGRVTTTSITLGLNSGASGLVTVGGGSLASAGDIVVGRDGRGDLRIEAGSAVTTSRVFIGNNAGSQGIVTVRGTGSSLIVSSPLGGVFDSLYVGFGGDGTLRVEAGGRVRSGSTWLGAWPGSTGEVLVTGAGSTLEAGALRVGFAEPSKLTIADGGRVTSNDLSVAIGRATVRVTGVGSTLDASTVPLGLTHSTSVLEITAGGTVRSGGASIGQTNTSSTSVATATVSGVGSSWMSGGDFVIGDFGRGAFRVDSGGAITSYGKGIIGNQRGGSNGAVTVTGAASRWTGMGELTIGEEGAGVLTLADGGRLAAPSVQIANKPDSSGTLVIGATAGQAAVATGILDAATVTFGSGSGAIVFNHTDANYRFSAAISGNGTVNQLAGITILTGANTYTGGTTIASGATLQVGNGGTAGSIAGNVANSGLLAFARSDATTFDGTISGAGGVAVQSGTVTFTANNTYTGATAIAAGATLQAGNGGTSGAIAGNVLNNGLLAFARSGATTFSGAISGAGGVQVQSGAVTFTGNNTYTGATSIAAGASLQVGNGGASGAVAGNIAALGTLIVNLSSDVAYGGVLSGNGLLRQIGSGMTTLTGDSSAFTGNTRVEGGVLAVNGRLGGTLTVVPGGQLQGTGTLGNVTLAGTVAPGNSIGTMNVGSITFQAGSIYQVEANAAGQSDKIVATGTATINGSSVQVLAGAGNYAPSTTYTILTAAGGRTGTFSGVTSNLAFLDAALTYDPTNVYLTLSRNAASFLSVGGTFNQRQTGSGVESLTLGNPVWNAVVQLSAPMARAAFDQLSGEVHASTKTALYEDSRLVRDGALSRLRSAFGGGSVAAPSTAQVAAVDDGSCSTDACQTDSKSGIAAWAQGFGSWGYTSGNGNAAGLSRSTGGVLVGVDAPVFEVARLGLFGGYSHTNFNVADRQSSGSSDNVHLGAYGGAQWGPIGVRAGLAYTWHNLSTSRSVAFPGFADSLRATYGAGTFQVFGEAGYRFDVGAAIFEPFANIAYMSLTTKGFSETGGAAALTGTGLTTNVTATTLGLRAGSAFTIAGLGGSARGTVGWQHAFTDTTPWANLQLTGGTPFTAAGVPIAQDAALLELGIDLRLSERASIGIGYTGQFAAGAQDQSVRGNFTFKF
jgi:fibronectin-binding autotransporter adhesin